MIHTDKAVVTDPAIWIRTDGFLLNGKVLMPENPVGVAVLANGTTEVGEVMSDIAEHLRDLGFATCIVDLITDQEGRLSIKGHAPRANAPLLRSRLRLVLDHIKKAVGDLPCVVISSGVAAAASISMAAHDSPAPKALVFIDGRLDIAHSDLRHLLTPSLFVIRGSDELLSDFNAEAFKKTTNAAKAFIHVGPTEQDWQDALQEIGAWACQFALKVPPK